jgi:hypothetical protein
MLRIAGGRIIIITGHTAACNIQPRQELKLLCEEMGCPFTEVYDSLELSYDWYL